MPKTLKLGVNMKWVDIHPRAERLLEDANQHRHLLDRDDEDGDPRICSSAIDVISRVKNALDSAKSMSMEQRRHFARQLEYALSLVVYR